MKSVKMVSMSSSQRWVRSHFQIPSILSQLRQQRQRVASANLLEIALRKAEFHHSFSGVGKRDKWIIAAEQNLRSWDKTRERSDSRPVGSTSYVVMEALEFVFDSLGNLVTDTAGRILVHTTDHHGHASACVGKYETNVEFECSLEKS